MENFLKCRPVVSLECCKRCDGGLYEIDDFSLFITLAETLWHTCFIEFRMRCCRVKHIWYSVGNAVCMPFK